MKTAWLMIADDLTGAADCAVAFAERHIASTVVWGDCDASSCDQSVALSYNVDSRSLSALHAAARHRDVLGRFLKPQLRLFKKIDSTLRGHPAAEIAAAIAAVRAGAGSAFRILAPAFPATGRTTEGGGVYVDGKPAEQARHWARHYAYQSADLVDILVTADVRSEKVALNAIRSDTEALRSTLASIATRADVVVRDELIQEDLDRIVVASLPAGDSTFFVGTAGLARALAASSPHSRRKPSRSVQQA